jgi:hypothetical protein
MGYYTRFNLTWSCTRDWKPSSCGHENEPKAKFCQDNSPLVVERSYWTSELDGKEYYNCFCPGCGAYMKGREAGVDEGTCWEWCGSCRP